MKDALEKKDGVWNSLSTESDAVAAKALFGEEKDKRGHKLRRKKNSPVFLVAD